MVDAKPRKQDWSLSRDAFDRLLAALDTDRERAGERYERVRQKLGRLFQWRGCVDPEEMVDITFDRVARRLEEGAEVRGSDPYLFFHGVALNVLKEHWRHPARSRRVVDSVLQTRGVPPESPVDGGGERRLQCLDECLDALPPESRRLLQSYHQGEKGDRIRARAELARNLGLSVGALRIRAHRIRAQAETCIASCEERAARQPKRNTADEH